MPLHQADLPKLSDHFFNVADSVARKELNRRFHKISGLRIEDNGAVRWTPARHSERHMPGLAIIAALRDIETIQSPDHNVTRRNIVTVSRLGGSALWHVDHTARQRHINFSSGAMLAIGHSAQAIHDRLHSTFRPLARELPDDREALYFIAQISRTISSGRALSMDRSTTKT